MPRLDLLACTSAELRQRANRWFGDRKGAGAALAVHRRATRQGVFDPAADGLGPRAAQVWSEHACLELPAIAASLQESTATGDLHKRALQLADGLVVESVHLPMGRGRSSLCVSTQAGCARACTFCETGRLGLLRNLTVAEIVGQVVLQHRDERPATLVFQGMGEPLDNLDGLLGAIAVLTDPAGLAYAHDRLTVCTVGHVPGIDALAHAGNKRLNLSLSLNAADDRQRAALMPRSVRYPLVEIAAALQRYRRRKNLALGIHWCLLPGLNDTPADAERIAAFCRDLGRVLVHVIPYNPGTAPVTRAPGEAEIDRFVALLRDRGLPVRRRMTKGRSVMAACGQLGGIGTATPGT